jgi:hypothetical protein
MGLDNLVGISCMMVHYVIHSIPIRLLNRGRLELNYAIRATLSASEKDLSSAWSILMRAGFEVPAARKRTDFCGKEKSHFGGLHMHLGKLTLGGCGFPIGRGHHQFMRFGNLAGSSWIRVRGKNTGELR